MMDGQFQKPCWAIWVSQAVLEASEPRPPCHMRYHLRVWDGVGSITAANTFHLPRFKQRHSDCGCLEYHLSVLRKRRGARRSAGLTCWSIFMVYQLQTREQR